MFCYYEFIQTNDHPRFSRPSRAVNSHPKKEQAVLFNAVKNTKITDYVFVGKILSLKALIAALQISNNKICIYLDSKSTINKFINKKDNTLISDVHIPACKLVATTNSNVHPCISDSLLMEVLNEYNLKSASIQNLYLCLNNTDDYAHLLSFRHFMYIYNLQQLAFPNSILITHENENYRIFISHDQICC